MSLQPQAIPVAFQPLNTRLDELSAPMGAILLLENGRYYKATGQGTWSVRKRPGQVAVTGASFPSPHRLGRFGDDLVAICRGGLYRYSQTAQNTAQLHPSAPWTPTTKPVTAATSTAATASAACVVGGYTVTAWIISPTTFYAIQDAAGVVLKTGSIAGPAGTTSLRALTVGSDAIVLSGGGGAVWAVKITPSTLTVGTAVAPVGAGANVWDAKERSTFVDIVYASGTANVSFSRLDTSSMTVTATRSQACVVSEALAILDHDNADGNIWCAGVGDIAATGTAHDVSFISCAVGYGSSAANTAVVSEANAVTRITGWVQPSTLERVAVYNTTIAASVGTIPLMGKVVNGGSGTGGTGVGATSPLFYGGLLASRAFIHNGRAYALATWDPAGTYQATAFLLDLYNPAIASAALQTFANAQAAGLTSVSVVSADKVMIGALRKGVVSVVAGAPVYAVGPVNLAFDAQDTRLGNPIEFAGGLTVPGGQPRFFDGASIFELGFPLDPEAPVLALNAAGGVFANGTTFSYVLTYEGTDASGRRWQSAPSIPTLLANNSGGLRNFDVKGYPPQIASTMPNAQTVIWRTTSPSGTVYRRLAAVVGNVPFTFTDTIADTVLSTGELLYSQPGDTVRENEPAPPTTVFGVLGDRLCAVAAEDGSGWYSKRQQDAAGVHFSGEYKFLSQGDDGRFTALLQHAGVLYWFRAAAIYGLTGDGPVDNSDGSDLYKHPPRIGDAHGTTLPMCVAATPAGPAWLDANGRVTTLQDAAGLSRQGAGAVPLGEPAYDYAGLSFRGAAVLPLRSEIHWLSSDGRSLVYDYVTGAWATDTNRAALGAVYTNGALYFVKADGSVVMESSAVSDAGTAIVTAMEVALPLGGLAGFAALWEWQVRGVFVGNHTLRCSPTFDGGTSADEAHNFVVTTGLYRNRFKPRRMDCSSVRMRIEDVFPGGATGGAVWSGLAVEAGIDPAIRRLAKSANATKT